MDAQELRNLQEAYMEVYQELDEVSHGDDEYERQWSHRISRGMKKLKPQSSETLEGPNRDVSRASGKYAGMLRRKKQGLSYKEETDLYDIILSHLLDEGYAETPEAAEKIMVNMGEEWLNDILDEARVDWHNRDQSNVTDRVNVLRDRNRRNVSGVPDGYQTAVRRTKHDVSRGKKKQKGLKTTSDNLGKMIRGPYRKQQYKRTGNDLYKD